MHAILIFRFSPTLFHNKYPMLKYCPAFIPEHATCHMELVSSLSKHGGGHCGGGGCMFLFLSLQDACG